MGTVDAGNRGRARTMFRIGAPFIAILLFIGFTQSIDIEDVGVLEARNKWEKHGPEAYELTYTYRGLGPATIVWDGTSVTEHRTDDPRLEDGTVYWVEAFLDIVDRAEDDIHADVVSVEFDDELGYPLRAELDPDNGKSGDEWSFEVLDLVALPS